MIINKYHAILNGININDDGLGLLEFRARLDGTLGILDLTYTYTIFILFSLQISTWLLKYDTWYIIYSLGVIYYIA